MVAPILEFAHDAIARAASKIKEGALVVFPTDTVYGLGCDPRNSTAVDRLFMAKGRGAKSVPVLCSSIDEAGSLVDLSQRALELARLHWPGALTIVAPLKIALPAKLHQGTQTLGVRIPSSDLCIELIRASGGILTGTSANVSGNPSCRTAEEALAELGESVDLILDGGRLDGQESTVVQVIGERLIVLRQGRVGVTDAKVN